MGVGKCTVHGEDPLYSYHANKGENCKELCDESIHCFGYSVSRYNNCLLWDEANLQGGGSEWGDAHCYVQDRDHVSARGMCSCDKEGSCSWYRRSNCVQDFNYRGLNYSGCTTVDFHNVGWCSFHRDYSDGEWGICTLQCPEGCFWMGRDHCAPRPQESQQCWHPPEACVPVYNYRGGLYHGCTTADNGHTGWCSHYFNFGAYGKWSNCTPCTATDAACAGAVDDGGAVPKLLGSAVVGAAAGAALLWTALRRQGNTPVRSVNSWALRRMDDLE